MPEDSPVPDARSRYRAGFWLAIGAAFGFSFKAIFVKLAYLVPGPAPVDAVTLLALRMAFAAPVFGIAALRTRSGVSLSPRQWAALVGVGLAGYYGASILDFWGLQYITAGLERLILFTYPTLTVLMGVLFFGKRLQRMELAAILLTYAGVAAAFAHDLNLAAEAKVVWLGAGLVFGSSLSYAVYLSAGGQFILRLGSVRFTALAMAVATAGTLVHYLLARPWGDVLHQPWPIYALTFGMALVSTVLPVFMQSAAIRAMGAGPASIVGMAGPLATLFFGWLLLGETLSSWQLFGASLVILGVFLVGRR
jgi:drug/metabolite transporter (DMT)-like permease